MRPIVVLNDLHIGALRSGGTTPATAAELRKFLLDNFSAAVNLAQGQDLIINGDLFDTANVPLIDLFSTLAILQVWLFCNPQSRLILPPGNHDLSKNSEVFSSFDFLAQYLQTNHPQRVLVPRGMMTIDDGVVVISHCPNQDLFELELAKVPRCGYLFLHCNYDNGFATKSDHSLNLSREQAEKLQVGHIVIGHVHQWATDLDEKVIVVGNQFPSSVADCLGNTVKGALEISTGGNWDVAQTWAAEGSFIQFEWTELADCTNTTCQFVRVIGRATAAQAAEVVAAISKFRQKTKALVVTNAVMIDGHDLTQAASSLEQIKAFNIHDELLAFLDEDMRAVVIKLLEKNSG